MPRAAIPSFIEQHSSTLLREASPGMRFGMYLPIWTSYEDQKHSVEKMAQKKSRKGQEVKTTIDLEGVDSAITRYVKEGLWEKNDSATREAWDIVKALNPKDRKRITALVDRQNGLIALYPNTDRLSVDAVGIAPFVTGMGNEHPLENGFAFLNPHGVPYLPASGVKGVLRAAAEELAGNSRRDWEPGQSFGWTHMFDTHLCNGPRSVIELLFGHDAQDGQTTNAPLFRGLLEFWDVIPQLGRDDLMVEIMTPHLKDYYEGKASPHESGQPNPIKFLAIPPGSRFTFHLRINKVRMEALGLTDTLGSVWQDLIHAAFDHAFQWLGFGAKTSLGYGAMAFDESAADERRDIERVQAEK